MTGLKTETLIRFLLIPLTIIFAAMVISGCGVSGTSQESPSLTPNISLLPDQTDFGVVVLDKSADKSIQIRNTGNGNLTIGQITLNNPATNPFSMISDSCSGVVISPSSSCGLIIRFAPTTQADNLGSLDIPSNDHNAGLLTTTLAGKGRALNVSINRVAMVDPQTVQVVVSVRNRFDDAVTTLAASNFSIKENGSPKSILNVSNTVKPPVSVGMVLDYSSSMTTFLPVVENAAKSFVDLLDPVNDEAEVIKFSSVITVMQPFTQDKVALKTAIDEPFLETYGTFLYDALLISINSTSLRSNPRLAIVMVSDGDECCGESDTTISDVTADAVYNNVQIFTIGIGNVDNVTMQQLATETGGQFFYDPTASDLTTVYSTISEILYNEYTIEYTTSSAAGSTISLDLLVDDNGQLGEDSITVDLF